MSLALPPGVPIDERTELLEQLADEGQTLPEVKAIASVTLALPPDERAAVLMAVVHRLPFVPDPPGIDIYQDVEETLQRGGDCEDLSTALVALCRAAGVPARIRFYNVPDRDQDHYTVEIEIDGAWVWAEPSIAGALLGEEPLAAARRLGAFAALGAIAT